MAVDPDLVPSTREEGITIAGHDLSSLSVLFILYFRKVIVSCTNTLIQLQLKLDYLINH